MKIALAALIALSSCTPAIAGYQPGYSNQRSCFKTEYREEYIPGTEDNPGYVSHGRILLKILVKMLVLMLVGEDIHLHHLQTDHTIVDM